MTDEYMNRLLGIMLKDVESNNELMDRVYEELTNHISIMIKNVINELEDDERSVLLPNLLSIFDKNLSNLQMMVMNRVLDNLYPGSVDILNDLGLGQTVH